MPRDGEEVRQLVQRGLTRAVRLDDVVDDDVDRVRRDREHQVRPHVGHIAAAQLIACRDVERGLGADVVRDDEADDVPCDRRVLALVRAAEEDLDDVRQGLVAVGEAQVDVVDR